MHIFLVFTLALAVAVATPGPGILAVVSCAIGRGLKDALAMTAGIMVGDLCYFTLAVTGMAALAHTMGDFFLIVKIAGALYLVWLGVKLWRTHQPATVVAGGSTASALGFKRSWVAGLTVTLGNPKAIAFYAGLLPTVVQLDRLASRDAILMGLIVLAVVGGIMALYALAAVRTRRFFGDERRLKLMNRTAGTIMIGAGVAVAVR